MKFLKLKKLLAGLTLAVTLLAPFSANALTIFPEGRATSGDLTISGSTTEDSVKSGVSTLANSGDTAVVVTSATGFVAGDYVMIIQMNGTGAGNYEINKIRSISSNTLNLFNPTISAYQNTNAQVIRIKEYHNVTVNSGGTWQPSDWDGTTGGVLVAMINGNLTLNTGGSITAVSKGFVAGAGASNPPGGTPGNGDGVSPTAGDGAGNSASGSGACGGGGGGHATGGGAGTTYALCLDAGGTSSTAGTATLESAIMGGSGGGGYGINDTGGNGGDGSGIILLITATTTLSGGTLINNGGAGASTGGPGGGGGGGSTRLLARQAINLGSGIVTATGGAPGTGNASAGAGGTGRVAVNSGATLTGTASPSADTSSTDRVANKDNDAQKFILGMAF